MKFVVFPEKSAQAKVVYTWRLETDAGFVLAKSTRNFDDQGKCLKELTDLKKDAAVTKIVKL